MHARRVFPAGRWRAPPDPTGAQISARDLKVGIGASVAPNRLGRAFWDKYYAKDDPMSEGT